MVRALIMQDPHVPFCEIESSLGISPSSIHSILHEHLAVKKIRSPQSLKKDYWRLVHRNVGKILWRCFKIRDKSWICAYEPEIQRKLFVEKKLFKGKKPF